MSTGRYARNSLFSDTKILLNSLNPLINNSDLLSLSYRIHKGGEVSEQPNYHQKYLHNFAGAQITAYGRGLKGSWKTKQFGKAYMKTSTSLGG